MPVRSRIFIRLSTSVRSRVFIRFSMSVHFHFYRFFVNRCFDVFNFLVACHVFPPLCSLTITQLIPIINLQFRDLANHLFSFAISQIIVSVSRSRKAPLQFRDLTNHRFSSAVSQATASVSLSHKPPFQFCDLTNHRFSSAVSQTTASVSRLDKSHSFSPSQVEESSEKFIRVPENHYIVLIW